MRRNRPHASLSFLALATLVVMFLAGCTSTEARLVKDMDAALADVPGVVHASTTYNTNNGMSTRITVRLTASADASLETVLSDSLHTFANTSGSTRGTISVAYYVFSEGDVDNGIRPTELGLPVTPTVDEIRAFASGAQ
ncbi:hypothetical protein CVS30_05070 [Arthrobacter psychrolactophilus]|uniref:Uncharacterized protein n=1 Tax=Arthrobacter psychrolactophilus TaxID=92442 RepID=A0A2V5JH87_9MICC|nr:hypothetical protein [Arthrobacter psychrolactophilus]PYI39337.1 hypothetical protein CVS30_05070 [Arthrobacter psychrolactophilus]